MKQNKDVDSDKLFESDIIIPDEDQKIDDENSESNDSNEFRR